MIHCHIPLAKIVGLYDEIVYVGAKNANHFFSLSP